MYSSVFDFYHRVNVDWGYCAKKEEDKNQDWIKASPVSPIFIGGCV